MFRVTDHFFLGGDIWWIKLVDANDPILIDRTGVLTLGVTDPMTMCVYISRELPEDMMTRVLIHEIGHCAIFSFNLLPDIHRLAKKRYWLEAEEWVCNFIADYGLAIFEAAYSTLGLSAWTAIPSRIEEIL